ncbi:arsenate reductase (glutaredoxin) [Paracoccus sp. S-4012]|uniref:arsenate reductase (glutaredoxin) n=1 Tax=Paracoccus sp. S-4012 TaxID=2665648 RepID=UPI0012AF9CF0|nr:arsenate reductase (glutaredoxin) [Paracoccus sp. S-4012]MRX50704.1 arsenate reductase (glutaredoxin) [Paracoccus sp. S-4012]
MTATIYHNPNCSTSRKVLEMLREAGEEPKVVEYLKAPPPREELRRLFADAGLTVREALRRRGTPYDELGLDDPSLSDEQLLDTIAAHPILLERPFVVTDRGTRLARPVERLHEIMDPA